MRIDIHSHLMSVAFLEHLRGRDAAPTAVRDGTGYIAHCAPGLSLPYRAPILSVEAKLADMDAGGIDLAVLGHGMPGPAMLGGTQADRCLDELGLAGFQVWSNIGGRPLDDPGVLPVLEHIAGRGAAIHLHPAPPSGQQGLAA